jgi:hypothetical protein
MLVALSALLAFVDADDAGAAVAGAGVVCVGAAVFFGAGVTAADVGLGEGLAVGVGFGDDEGVALGVGFADGLGLDDADALAFGEALAVGDALGDAVADDFTVGDGDGLGVKCRRGSALTDGRMMGVIEGSGMGVAVAWALVFLFPMKCASRPPSNRPAKTTTRIKGKSGRPPPPPLSSSARRRRGLFVTLYLPAVRRAQCVGCPEAHR